MFSSALLASLFLFFGLAAAGQIIAPVCTVPSWSWTYNSLGQNPCTVAAYLLSTCNQGSYTLKALPGPEYDYSPTSPSLSDLCQCNTVTYSLLSACEACQGATQELTWKAYTQYCAKVLPPKEIPYPIPPGTRVPHWAAIDVTIKGAWDPVEAQNVGDSPEYVPGK